MQSAPGLALVGLARLVRLRGVARTLFRVPAVLVEYSAAVQGVIFVGEGSTSRCWGRWPPARFSARPKARRGA